MDYTIGSLIFFSGFVTGVAAGIIGGLKLMAWGMTFPHCKSREATII